MLSHHLILERWLSLSKYPKFKIRPIRNSNSDSSRENKPSGAPVGDPSSSPNDTVMQCGAGGPSEVETVDSNVCTLSGSGGIFRNKKNCWAADVYEESTTSARLQYLTPKWNLFMAESFPDLKPAAENTIIEEKEESILQGADLSRIAPPFVPTLLESSRVDSERTTRPVEDS